MQLAVLNNLGFIEILVMLLTTGGMIAVVGGAIYLLVRKATRDGLADREQRMERRT